MPDWNQFKTGGATQPLALTGSALQVADPAIFYFLDFLTYVVKTYPGPRLLQDLIAAGITAPNGKPIASVVAQAYPYEPAPEFLENQFTFPALFLYRTVGQTEQWTASFDHDICGVTVAYVLPPLDAAGCERILPFLKSVYDAIRRKTNDAWDPGYTPPGGNLGDQFDAPAYANLEEVGFGVPIDKRVASVSTGFEYGRLQGTGDIWFPALLMRGYIIERDDYAPTIGGPSKFDGADIAANVAVDDGTKVLATSSGVVQVSTQLPPSVTSIDVATGPSSGGTAVNITGLRFLSGPPTVFFGPASNPQYAASVAFNSSMSLTVTTPAVSGAGTLDLTILNRDSQMATLVDAFTFT